MSHFDLAPVSLELPFNELKNRLSATFEAINGAPLRKKRLLDQAAATFLGYRNEHAMFASLKTEAASNSLASASVEFHSTFGEIKSRISAVNEAISHCPIKKKPVMDRAIMTLLQYESVDQMYSTLRTKLPEV